MIETMAKNVEAMNLTSEQNVQTDMFNPDKRLDSVIGNADSIVSDNYNPDKRIETPLDSSMETNGEIGSIDNPRNIITRNEALEGEVHPITGVPFERRVIETPEGEFIEGVFAKFNSLFDARIPEKLYKESDKTQFKECNRQFLDAIESNPVLKEQFSSEQIDQIKEGIYEGTAPDGFVWHHDTESGKLQLVDAEVHAKTGHTGGRLLWGGGTESRQ